MREWLDALLAVLLAPGCAACTRPLTHPTRGCICQNCWTTIVTVATPFCDRCGDPLAHGCAFPSTSLCMQCVRSASAVARARAVGPHIGSLRAIVHALKYDGRRSVAAPLAGLMRSAGADVLRECDLVVPVPLHPSRRRARGFNQAEDLARHIGLPMVRALKRSRHTETQTALPAQERHANVAGAFEPTRHAAALRGATVVVIDDVRTTGATLNACAKTLREVGVREVRALTAARVETPGA